MWWTHEITSLRTHTRIVYVFVAGFLVTSLVIYALQYKHSHDTQHASSVREMVKKVKATSRKAATAMMGKRKRESTTKTNRQKRSQLKSTSNARAKPSEDVVVVFDFDETLGCFQELSDLSQAIANQRKRQLNPYEYVELFQILPHYIRPRIIELLIWLYKMKRTEMPWLKVMIYTNNMGGRKWVKDISSAIELIVKGLFPPSNGRKSLSYALGDDRLFDQIIYAYSVDGVHLEKKRTSHEKKYVDFLSCTRYKQSTKVIFVDDVLHKGMLMTPYVKYIHVPAYKWLYGRARIERMIYQYYTGEAEEDVADANIPGVLNCLNYQSHPTSVSVIKRHEEVAIRLRREIESGIAWAREEESKVPVAGAYNKSNMGYEVAGKTQSFYVPL